MNITPQNLRRISFKGTKVITTDLLGILYETKSRRITENFNRNIQRFSEGVHYFKLSNGDLKEFKSKYALSVSVKISKNVNSLYLWTKRGVARHAKILDTDKAWDVFDVLEECYFSKDTNLIQIDPSKNQPEVLQLAADQAKKLKEQEPYVTIANEFLTVPDSLKGTDQIAKELGIGEITLFRFLREEKIFFYSYQNSNKVNIPYQIHIDSGRVVVKNITTNIGSGDDKKKVNYSRSFFTPKGEAHVCLLLKKREDNSKARDKFFKDQKNKLKEN